jgi:hypothetical protein
MTMGFSRDDAGKFLPAYLKQGIYDHDPFRSIDQKGVGLLVEMAAQKGRACARHRTRRLGVCGEHGGDPASVGFFHRAGLDYVSCSPFRVPIARLAAAQAAVRALAATHVDLAKRLSELEEKTEALALNHDTFSRNTRSQFKQVFEALRELMTPPDPPKRPIGFVLPEEKSGKRRSESDSTSP